MAWIVDLMYVLGVLGGLSDKKISSGPLTGKEVYLLKKEIFMLIKRAEDAYNNGYYSDACKEYIKALKLENINPDKSPDSAVNLRKRIERIENMINKDTINKFILISEKGDYLKKEAKFQAAYNEYEKMFSLVRGMTISDSNLRAGRVNEIYLKQINCLIKEGNAFGSAKSSEKSGELFSKALELAGSMVSSVEKNQIIKKLNNILDRYSETINEIIKSGISLTKQNQFEEAIPLFQKAQNIIKEKYSKLSNTMTNRFKETSDLREVRNLIEQSKNKTMIDVNAISLLKVSSDRKINDFEEKKKDLPVISDQPSHYTCKYCGIDLNEKPRFCPKCGIICSENSN